MTGLKHGSGDPSGPRVAPRAGRSGTPTQAQDGAAKTAALLTLNTRALRAFEGILAQARELAKSEA